MINKKEFDLLLQEIFQIENKIVEIKVLKQFEKASEFENTLELIKVKAKDIVLDNENKSKGLDELALEVISELIVLYSEVDYYILKTNNIIESAIENKIDAEALEKIKKSWNDLEKYIEFWNQTEHNPIEQIEYSKYIGKLTLDNIIYQLQKEGVIDFPKIFKYCKKEFLLNAVKETLFEGAKEEFSYEIRRNNLINLAKDASENDLYDYKLWQQILMIRNIRSRDDHIEMIGSIKDRDDRKYIIDENDKKIKEINLEDEQDLDVLYDESIISMVKRWFLNLNENANQRRMGFTWGTSNGPAFKAMLENGNVKYSREYLDKNIVENTQKLIIASNGIAKYNFEKDSEWKKLEKLEFFDKDNITAVVNLSPDKTYNCIGNDSFANADNLQEVLFGKIEIIGERAFANCNKLSSITFSKNLMNIGEDAFLNCKNLSKITFLGDLKIYILDRPQNVINCFKGTNLQEISFPNIETAFNLAIADCPSLEKILISSISNISIPFKTCKYRIGRQEGIVSFAGENSLVLWKKKNSSIRFFELTDEDKKKFNIKD